VVWLIENRKTPTLTMSEGAGSLAGVHVDGDDQAPLAALRIVGFAAKFGTWSWGV